MTGYLTILLSQLRGAPAQVRPRPRARFELVAATDDLVAPYAPAASAPAGEPRAATTGQRDVPAPPLPDFGAREERRADGAPEPEAPLTPVPRAPRSTPGTTESHAAASAASRTPAPPAEGVDPALAPERQVWPDQPAACVVQPVPAEAAPRLLETFPPVGPEAQRPSPAAAPVAAVRAHPPADLPPQPARRVFAPTTAREAPSAAALAVPDPLPDVTVVIGRLDVRLERASPLPRGTTAQRRDAGESRASAAPSLDEYLTGRGAGA
jgi:hypothetical protein